MKTIRATRQIKEEITRHFKRGGAIENLPEHLKGVPHEVVESCHKYAIMTSPKLQKKIAQHVLNS